MPKTVTYQGKKWTGSVTFSDPLTFPQVLKFEQALRDVRALEDPSQTEADAALLPAVLNCVETWNLDKFPQVVTVESFPATPRVSSALLVAWLVNQVVALYNEGEGDPNE